MASPATTHPAAEAASDGSLLASGAWAAVQAPAAWTRSRATTRASAATRASLQRRVRPAATTAMASSAAPASHGSGDGPGTQRTSPTTSTRCPPVRSFTVHSGMTRCGDPGARRTWAGGRSASQWARWSCQVTDWPRSTRRQLAGAPGSTAAGGGLSARRGPAIRSVGDREFSNTPRGPTRSQGSSW
jgi:hypothetical protein